MSYNRRYALEFAAKTRPALETEAEMLVRAESYYRFVSGLPQKSLIEIIAESFRDRRVGLVK